MEGVPPLWSAKWPPKKLKEVKAGKSSK